MPRQRPDIGPDGGWARVAGQIEVAPIGERLVGFGEGVEGEPSCRQVRSDRLLEACAVSGISRGLYPVARDPRRELAHRDLRVQLVRRHLKRQRKGSSHGGSPGAYRKTQARPGRFERPTSRSGGERSIH
jgi:hypothetical protein